jgi:hypothetical protein
MPMQEHPASGSDGGSHLGVTPPSRAVVLSDEIFSSDGRKLTVLLDFFGIPWKTVTSGELAGECAGVAKDRGERVCILSSAPSMAAALEGIADSATALPAWMSSASSVYIYGFQQTAQCRGLLRLLMRGAEGEIRKPTGTEVAVTVTNDFPDLCGPLSGIRASVQVTDKDLCFDLQSKADEVQSIVTTDCGGLFVSALRSGVRFFLNPSSAVIDIQAPAKSYFDVKEHFCSAVPIAMYLRWAFAGTSWTGTETRGCLIVDDPNLKPRYGFLRFSDALDLMDSHNFTTSIAFIPWNWRRTDRKTVRQFQLRNDRLSLCVHGCDHSAGEFATRSTALLNRRIKTAIERMELLSRKTSLEPDTIMVFPQGSFSPEAGRALKLNGFVAAVNTEVAPSGGAQNDTTIADLWSVAIMKYGTFPIFTRRYITHGLENFAFDALLGKPCLLVAHHEVFKARGRELMEFIGRLNSLKWTVRWGSLGDAIRHSFRSRKAPGGAHTIRMYAECLVIENQSAESQKAIVKKQESDYDCVQAVTANQEAVAHVCENGDLQFAVTTPPGEKTEIRIVYFDKLELDPDSGGMAYRTKIRIRRHLSEFRDNYVSQNDLLYAIAAKLKRLLS